LGFQLRWTQLVKYVAGYGMSKWQHFDSLSHKNDSFALVNASRKWAQKRSRPILDLWNI